MALVRTPDGAWHLTAPDQVAGDGTRLHHLDEMALPDADVAALEDAIRRYDVAVAHYQPAERRWVLVERNSIAR